MVALTVPCKQLDSMFLQVTTTELTRVWWGHRLTPHRVLNPVLPWGWMKNPPCPTAGAFQPPVMFYGWADKTFANEDSCSSQQTQWV